MRARSKVFWLTVWALAFGLLEGAVVTYLRRLVCAGAPLDGPLFPLRMGDGPVLVTEIAREAATLVMLLGVAMLAERRGSRRFAAFALCFGVWDLAYYAMLKLSIGWPRNLGEWDILFLIPAPWAAPVWAPVLVSIALVACAALVLVGTREDAPPVLRASDWFVLCTCGGLVLATFFWNTPRIVRLEAPAGYPWALFLAGWLGGLACFARAWTLARRA